MSKIIINSSRPLSGEVSISGSKNAALPVLAATILVDGKSILENIPSLSDIDYMCEILSVLDCLAERRSDGTIEIDSTCSKPNSVPYELTGKLRASFLITGPLLARYGRARVALPGGCTIGTRPVDLHLKGLAALGGEYFISDGYVDIKSSKLKGARICLDFPSVGATQNIMMAATLAEGETTIENCASEPEITDLADFLISCGAHISGAGTDTITVSGVKRLRSSSYSIISDRIEAGTFMLAALATHGSIRIKNINLAHLSAVTAKLAEIGVTAEPIQNGIAVNGNCPKKATDIKTMPFPGFPTDMQSQIAATLCCAEGTSVITETIFENRFMYVPELIRMNADIKVEGRTAVITGTDSLVGAEVSATDLRAGAALVIAGLCARGKTVINNAEYLKRGYCNLDAKLSSLGAVICYEE